VVEFKRFEERAGNAFTGFFTAGRLPACSFVGVGALPRGALVGMDFVVHAPG
jgi:hypothetical protein